MGKGVIVEHLGDAHYRIGLDIDVSYARDQLTAINLYLDEFAPKYAEATQAKNDAQAALTPINDRLTVYLADAQLASQTAYDAMVAAYDEWLTAVEHQPDPGGADFLLDALSDAKSEFDTAHDQYIMALDGDPKAELTQEEALTDRTNALALLSVAMSDFQNGVGPLLDETAVNDALDLLGVALSDFENATVAYAADPSNPTLESAMNYYRGEYDSAHSDWVSAVNNNSGDVLVQAKRDAYVTTAEAFDTARENLGSLLGNGGMPAELASIMADQERAWATYHGALQNWQSLTLIKVEKESAKAELMSRLLPYTDPNGDPIRQTVNAWCCDLTEDMTVGAEVATIEIPGERDLAVRVRPGYESRETYSAARDGLLQPSWASSPEATYWNWALHPGNARWNPTYRLGEILFVDQDANTCTVQLDQQRNNEKSRARDGNTLDVINPVKYAIDPATAAQTFSTPGDNVMVEGGVTTLTDVPIEYMECNAAVFEVGDHVMVEFQNRAWTQPKVIGFADNPKPCMLPGVIFTANIGASTEQVYWPDAKPVLRHPISTQEGGNLDWLSTDGKTRLSWDGPFGRSIPPAMKAGGSDSIYIDVNQEYSIEYVRLFDGADTPQDYTKDDQRWYGILQRFQPYIYKGGKRIATAPKSSPSPASPFFGILGAATIQWKSGSQEKTFLVAAMTVPAINAQKLSHEYGAIDAVHHPECVNIVIAWAEMTSAAITSDKWSIIGTIDLSANPIHLPTTNAVFFSGSGKKFATLIPTGSGKDTLTTGCDDYSIVRGELAAAADGVTLVTSSTTRQSATGSYSYAYDYNSAYSPPPFQDWHADGYNSRSQSVTSSAIVGVDFIGDQEVTLSGRLSINIELNESFVVDINDVFGGGYYKIATGTDQESETVSGKVTDNYRNVDIADVSGSYSNTDTVDQAGPDATRNTNTVTHWRSTRPLYYDLRSGAGYFIKTSYDRHWVNPHEWYAIDTGIGYQLWQRYSIDYGYTYSCDITDKQVVVRANTQHDLNFTDSGEYRDDSAEYPSVGISGLENKSGSLLLSSASSASSVPWIRKRTLFGGYVENVEVPLYMRCQNVGKDDEVVVRGTHGGRPIWMEGVRFQTLPYDDDGLDYVFSSKHDIDALWQSHLDDKHSPVTQTALAADLTPKFRR